MSSPIPMFGMSDNHDDDGQVIDSLLVEVDAPPDLNMARQPIVVPGETKPVETTRLLTGTMLFNPTDVTAPSLLLPADAQRKSLTIRVYSPSSSTTDAVRFGDGTGSCASGGFWQSTDQPLTLDGHTGGVWFLPQSSTSTPGSPVNNAAAIRISWWAVTR